MREAPSVVIINKLVELGASVCAYDPVAMPEAKKMLNANVNFANDPYEALIDADAFILVTEWTEFRVLNIPLINKVMKQHVVFDGRNIYDPQEMAENGFTYYSIGR